MGPCHVGDTPDRNRIPPKTGTMHISRHDNGRGTETVPNDFTMEDLSDIRDAVPHLDLVAIRALRRAGFDIVRSEASAPVLPNRTFWNNIPHPMVSSILRPEHLAAD